MPTFVRYIIARRFLVRYLGRHAAKFVPGGWVVFLVYPIVRRAWRRRMRRRSRRLALSGERL